MRMIAIPTSKGGFMDFWTFVKDDGRAIDSYMIRFNYNGRQDLERIRQLLGQGKRDYLDDLKQFDKDRKMGAVAMFQSGKKRAIKREIDKQIATNQLPTGAL